MLSTVAPSTGASAAHPDLYDLCAGAWRELMARQPRLGATAPAPTIWIGRAAETLAANLRSGRWGTVGASLAAAPADAEMLRSYAQQILIGLLTEEQRLARLRAGETDAWRPVLDRLERLAFFWHGPFGREEWAAWEAREVAAATCADLWHWLQSHAFPFDTPFDRWSARALINRLQERARQRRRAPAMAALECDGLPCEPPGESGLDALILREALQEALAGLPPRQATVIRLWYLEGWRADEIAAQLKTPIGNVYVLRHRGLRALRKTRLQALAPRTTADAGKLM